MGINGGTSTPCIPLPIILRRTRRWGRSWLSRQYTERASGALPGAGHPAGLQPEGPPRALYRRRDLALFAQLLPRLELGFAASSRAAPLASTSRVLEGFASTSAGVQTPIGRPRARRDPHFGKTLENTSQSAPRMLLTGESGIAAGAAPQRESACVWILHAHENDAAALPLHSWGCLPRHAGGDGGDAPRRRGRRLVVVAAERCCCGHGRRRLFVRLRQLRWARLVLGALLAGRPRGGGSAPGVETQRRRSRRGASSVRHD